jgi:hypothetical protein
LAAAPAPPHSSLLPALEPPAGASGTTATTAPGLLAGIEPARQAGGGGEGGAGRRETVTSALGALQARRLNESKSDFDTGLTPKSEASGENGRRSLDFGAQTIPEGFSGKPALLFGADTSQPTTEQSAGGLADMYAFRHRSWAIKRKALRTNNGV